MLRTNDFVRNIIATKTRPDSSLFILRADRQAIAAVLIDAIIQNLGTRYVPNFVNFSTCNYPNFQVTQF